MRKIINSFTKHGRVYTLEKDEHGIYRIRIDGVLRTAYAFQKMAIADFERLKHDID